MDLSKHSNESFDEYFGRLAKIQTEAIKNNDKELIQKINNIVYDYKPLRQYIDAYCRSSWRTYYNKYGEDLVHSGAEEFFKNFHKFDNSKAQLITFSKLHILHGAQKFIAFVNNKRTVFEKEIAANVDIIKKRLLSNGFNENMITASIVHTYLPKYAYSQIEACLKGNMTLQPLEDNDIDNLGNNYSSAENEYLKQMYKEDTSEIFKGLLKYEAYLLTALDPDCSVIKMYQAYEKDATLIKLLKEAGLDKYVKVKKDTNETYVSTTDIKKLLSGAKKHLFHLAIMKNEHYRTLNSHRRTRISDSLDFNLLSEALENEQYLYKEFGERN